MSEGDVKSGPSPSHLSSCHGNQRQCQGPALEPANPSPPWLRHDSPLLPSSPRFWLALVTVAAMALCHSQAASCMSCRGVLVKGTAALSGQVWAGVWLWGEDKGPWICKEKREKTEQTCEFISSRAGCRENVIWRWCQSLTWNAGRRFQSYLSSADRRGWLQGLGTGMELLGPGWPTEAMGEATAGFNNHSMA